MNKIQQYFSGPVLKKTKVKLGLVTDIDIILSMVEKGIIGGICHAVH